MLIRSVLYLAQKKAISSWEHIGIHGTQKNILPTFRLEELKWFVFRLETGLSILMDLTSVAWMAQRKRSSGSSTHALSTTSQCLWTFTAWETLRMALTTAEWLLKWSGQTILISTTGIMLRLIGWAHGICKQTNMTGSTTTTSTGPCSTQKLCSKDGATTAPLLPSNLSTSHGGTQTLPFWRTSTEVCDSLCRDMHLKPTSCSTTPSFMTQTLGTTSSETTTLTKWLLITISTKPGIKVWIQPRSSVSTMCKKQPRPTHSSTRYGSVSGHLPQMSVLLGSEDSMTETQILNFSASGLTVQRHTCQRVLLLTLTETQMF